MKPITIPGKLAAGLAAATAIWFLASTATTQPSSSTTYFLPATERAPGGQCSSTTYRLEAVIGAGVVARQAFSSNFKILGGFNTASDTPIAGQPWMTCATPMYGPILGGTTHTLHGHELALGPATNITIGGKSATVLSRAPGQVKVTLPAQTAPGWQPVTATNSGGTAHLSPRGVGILPMVEKAWAIEINQPFRITYRGTQGDIFFIAVAGAMIPGPAPIPPYHHGLELNFGALLGFLGPLQVTDPSGEFHLDIKGIPFVRPIYLQILGLPTANPGYSPGSFTNTIAL